MTHAHSKAPLINQLVCSNMPVLRETSTGWPTHPEAPLQIPAAFWSSLSTKGSLTL